MYLVLKLLKSRKKNNVDGYKIHSSDLNNIHLLNLIKDPRKKFLFLLAEAH